MRLVASFLIATITAPALLAQEPGTRAQVPGSQGSRPKIVTATRPVVMFTHIERDILTAVQQRKPDAIKAVATPDFEMLLPAPPGEPVILNTWLEQVATGPAIAAFRTSQMSVHSISDDAAIVSFVQSIKLDEKTPKFEDQFIVDYWVNDGGTWRLKLRYTSPVQDYPHPGSPKPTGKE